MTVDRYTDPPGVARWIRTAQPAAEFADRIADTEFVPAAMRGRPAMVAACIMYGDEIGVGPMQALASIHVVDGRPFPSAELLRALVLRDGHVFRVIEATGTSCTVLGIRAGRPESEGVRVTWTIEMARAAGLAGKGAWRSYPRALLVARASTDLARMLFPDVVKGLGHVPDDSPAVAEDWAELTTATGLPDTPAPTAARSLQWTPPPKPAASGPTPPVTGSGAVPWEDDATDEPAAVTEAPTAADESELRAAFERAQRAHDAAPTAADESERPVDRENVRRILAAYGDLGYDASDRETRLSLFSAILGFPVTSTNDLERMAGYRLFGALGKLRDGTLIAVADGHGGFSIHAGAEPEGDDDDGP